MAEYRQSSPAPAPPAHWRVDGDECNAAVINLEFLTMGEIQSLHKVRALVRWVLALYVLTISVAIAAPLFHDDPLVLLCSTAGGVKLVQVDTDDVDAPTTETHLLDCVMCLPGGGVPPQSANITALVDFDQERYFSPVARLRSRTPITASARDPPKSS